MCDDEGQLDIMHPDRRFLRYDEAATYVLRISGATVSANTIRSWVRHGAPSYDDPDQRHYLPARRINRAIVIPKRDMDSWLANQDINIAAGGQG